MLKITKSDYDKILKHAESCLPEEACGLIGGNVEDGYKVVKKVYILENIDHSNEHFSMNPKDQFDAIKDMRKNGFEQFGNFHSHPESPSRPSEEDKRLAYDSKASYLILSLMERDNPVLRAFNINGDEVAVEEIIFID